MDFVALQQHASLFRIAGEGGKDGGRFDALHRHLERNIVHQCIASGLLGDSPGLSHSGRLLIEFRDHHGEHIACGMLADEDIEVPVTWQQVQRMTARLLAIEPGKGLLLTLRQETAIVLASKEDEPRIGTWWIDAEAWR